MGVRPASVVLPGRVLAIVPGGVGAAAVHLTGSSPRASEPKPRHKTAVYLQSVFIMGPSNGLGQIRPSNGRPVSVRFSFGDVPLEPEAHLHERTPYLSTCA